MELGRRLEAQCPGREAGSGKSPWRGCFSRSADEWAHASADRDRWRGLALYGVDGTTLRVPDTEENADHFGSESRQNQDEKLPEKTPGTGPMHTDLIEMAAEE